jgi:hypothetical protein
MERVLIDKDATIIVLKAGFIEKIEILKKIQLTEKKIVIFVLS